MTKESGEEFIQNLYFIIKKILDKKTAKKYSDSR